MVRILVFNVGSSTIKFSVFENEKKLCSEKYERLETKKQYKEAIKEILSQINKEQIDIIAHRVVHGGYLKKPTKITKQVLKQIKKFSEFAPLHNPKQLSVIKACKKLKKPQYAVFDTAFFTALPEITTTYAIPKEIIKKYSIKKYGFHGISHKYLSKNLKGKTITCHLGAGVSITAIKDKKPLDTSMGLTPLEGILMQTRSGSIDPGIILFLQKKGFNLEKILRKQSGLLGLSGKKDFRDILKKSKNKNCKLAYEIFAYQIAKTIASYTATLNGLDNLVFSAAIGENVPKLRKDICKNLECLGIKLNNKANLKNAKIISSKSSKIKVHVIKTDEEQQIVNQVLKIER